MLPWKNQVNRVTAGRTEILKNFQARMEMRKQEQPISDFMQDDTRCQQLDNMDELCYGTPKYRCLPKHDPLGIRKREPMSLIVALKSEDSVVMSVDSRSIEGTDQAPPARQCDSEKKYIKLSDKCVMGFASEDADISDFSIERFYEGRSESLVSVIDIVGDASVGLKKSFDQSTRDIPESLLNLVGMKFGVCIAGLDDSGIAHLFDLRSRNFFAIPKEKPYVILGVPYIADYWIYGLQEQRVLASLSDMSIKYMQRLALWVQIATSTWHFKVGGPVHIITITEKDGFQVDTVGADDPRRQECKEFSNKMVGSVGEWLQQV